MPIHVIHVPMISTLPTAFWFASPGLRRLPSLSCRGPRVDHLVDAPHSDRIEAKLGESWKTRGVCAQIDATGRVVGSHTAALQRLGLAPEVA